MYRITSMMLGTIVASVCFSTSAQAAGSMPPFVGSLDFGDQVIAIPALNDTVGAIAYEFRFNLQHDSVLTGALTGISVGAVTLKESWFNEVTGQSEFRTLARSMVFGEQPFDLGTQPASSHLVSLSPRSYQITMSGSLVDPAKLTGASFTLSVRPAVPEPTSLVLMGLGLVGVAAVRRRGALA